MTTNKPTSWRPDVETLADLARKKAAWRMGRSAFINLSIKMMPDEPPQHGDEGKAKEKNDD